MSDKYFTPKIEEIRVGIECEIPFETADNYKSIIIETKEELHKLFSSYSNTRIRILYLNHEQVEKDGWFKKGEIFYKGLWSLVLLPNYRITIKFGDEKRYFGKCKDVNTLRYICKLLEID